MLPHPGDILLIAFSPDAKTLLTICLNQIRLWEVATRKLLAGPFTTEAGYTLEYVGGAVFSPDGRWLLIGGGKNEARLWDATTGKPVGPMLPHSSSVRSLAFSPDGQWIVTAGDKTAQVWDAATGKPVGEPIIHRGTIARVAFDPNSRLVLTNCLDGTAQRLDLATHKAAGRGFQSPGRVDGDSRFSPDGRTILMVQGDGRTRFGDTVTGRLLGGPVQHNGAMRMVAFAPDGSSVLLRDPGERTLRLWEVPRPLEGELERIVCWTEVITGMELDAEGAAHVLEAASWHDRRHRLDEMRSARWGHPPQSRRWPAAP
jgi:WD40 repeat protein